VRDTGIGIGPETLPYVFEMFAQADRSLARSRGGLGLGLALVKWLVELHGGEVRAESEGVGRGTEFTVWLPIALAPTATEAAPPPAAVPARPARILIVDDNPDAVASLLELLELFDHTVAVVYSGPEGVEVARQFRPEVVLCDLGLPGFDGYQVATALRQGPVTAATRLIVVSGYGQIEDEQRAREAGFDQYLVKPIDIEDLKRLLAETP
jgi:CheY-like chemotaxis protein